MSAVTQLRHPEGAQRAEIGAVPHPVLHAAPEPDARDALVRLDAGPAPSAPSGIGRGLPTRPAVTPLPGATPGEGAHSVIPVSSSPVDTDPETMRRIYGIARSVTQGALEVLGGSRPLQQMARWVDPENYERLQLRANLVRCIGSATTDREGRARTSTHRNVVVRSARVCPVGRGVYEASVVAFDQERVRAVALRIEQRRGVWRVTALEIG